MLTIYNGRKHFWQWDSGQRLVVETGAGCEVHFRNPSGKDALIAHTYEMYGKTVADVPDILLQSSGQISAWVYICIGDDCTISENSFDVWPRQKPSDYVYTEPEKQSYERLEQRIDDLEKNGVSDEQIEKAVTKYLDENPIDTGVNFTTDETLTLNEDGVLSVNMAEAVEKDNTLPVTSGAVYAEVGNINALLETI